MLSAYYINFEFFVKEAEFELINYDTVVLYIRP